MSDHEWRIIAMLVIIEIAAWYDRRRFHREWMKPRQEKP